MQVHTYLMFNGRCEEALEFYKQALGAQVKALMRYKESPDPVPSDMLPKTGVEGVMHSEMMIGDSMVMATDGSSHDNSPFGGFSLTVTLPDKDAAARTFAALSAGGKVTMPMAPTFWSPAFGMLTDRFGVAWMVMTAAAAAAA